MLRHVGGQGFSLIFGGGTQVGKPGFQTGAEEVGGVRDVCFDLGSVPVLLGADQDAVVRRGEGPDMVPPSMPVPSPIAGPADAPAGLQLLDRGGDGQGGRGVLAVAVACGPAELRTSLNWPRVEALRTGDGLLPRRPACHIGPHLHCEMYLVYQTDPQETGGPPTRPRDPDRPQLEMLGAEFLSAFRSRDRTPCLPLAAAAACDPSLMH